jgi:hypothetical protein
MMVCTKPLFFACTAWSDGGRLGLMKLMARWASELFLNKSLTPFDGGRGSNVFAS